MAIDFFIWLHTVSFFLGGAFLFLAIDSFLRWTAPSSLESERTKSLPNMIGTGLLSPIFLVSILAFTAPAFIVDRAIPMLLILLCCLFYPEWQIVSFVRKNRRNHGLFFFYSINVYTGLVQVLNQLRVMPTDYLRPLFFLHSVPALSEVAEFRIEQQLVFYLFNLAFSLYLVFGFIALHRTGPQPQLSIESIRPASADEIIRECRITEREAEILEWAVKGLTYEAIADKCCISKGTVKLHLSSIYRKVGVKNKTELASLFIRKK